MSIKKENKRITITLDPEHLKRFEIIKEALGIKNNALAFKKLIDLYTYTYRDLTK